MLCFKRGVPEERAGGPPGCYRSDYRRRGGRGCLFVVAGAQISRFLRPGLCRLRRQSDIPLRFGSDLRGGFLVAVAKGAVARCASDMATSARIAESPYSRDGVITPGVSPGIGSLLVACRSQIASISPPFDNQGRAQHSTPNPDRQEVDYNSNYFSATRVRHPFC